MLPSDLIPPVFMPLMKRLFLSNKIYKTYEEALRDSDGYDNEDIAEITSLATQQIIKNHTLHVAQVEYLQYYFVLNEFLKRTHKKINVLDIGGGLGATYHELVPFFPGKISHWDIVETPTMATYGKKHYQTDSLRFYSDIESVMTKNSYTLCVLKGVLQYLPSPIKVLQYVCQKNIPNIYISRQPILFMMKKDIITIQKSLLKYHGSIDTHTDNDKIVSMPITYISKDRIKEIFKKYRYNFVYNFSERDDEIILNHKMYTIEEFGYLLKRK